MSLSFKNNMMNILEKGLDAASTRNRVVANNIANVSTPGYKKSVVRFEDKLEQVLIEKTSKRLNTTNARHFSVRNGRDINPEVIKTRGTTQRQDENNVNMEVEISTMQKNTILYNALIDQLNDRLSNLRYVITEGRR